MAQSVPPGPPANETFVDTYDYCVLGCGGIGSAAVYWLARFAQQRGKGERVLGLEQFELGHHRGGSQDHSRIVRLAYHQEYYSQLAVHSYTAWRAIEDESGVKLLHKTGGIVGGNKNLLTLEHYADAFKRQGIPFEDWTAEEAMKRFPQLRLAPDDRVIYQSDSGFIDARLANATHIGLARERGATILDHAELRSLQPLGQHAVEITTSRGTFRVRRLVITADAWTNDVLGYFGMHLPLIVSQEQVTYFSPRSLREFTPDRFPVWIWHTNDAVEGGFYGIPVYGEVGTKAGQHEGGVHRPVTAHTRTFVPDKERTERLRQFLEEKMPGYAARGELYTKTCLYTLTPDRDFIIDKLPAYPQVCCAVGAGHAYKFAGIIGLVLAQLAVDGTTPYDLKAFAITRPAIAQHADTRLGGGAPLSKSKL